MTEIRIEKRPPLWPWLLGVFALALVGWIAFATLGDDVPTTDYTAMPGPGTATTPVPGEGTVGTSGAAPAAIQDYSAFANDRTELAPGSEHAYTAGGIRRLSAALEAFVEQNAKDAETRNRFDRFRQSADRLQQDPQSREHANTVRDVFTSAVDVLESGKVDAGDVSRLRETASSISPERPLLDQTDRVQQFFSQSADALTRAAHGRTH